MMRISVVTAFFRSMLFQLTLYGVLFPLGLLCLLWTLFFPARLLRFLVMYWSRLVLAVARLLLALEYRVSGLEHVPQEGAVLAALHQSIWETFFFQCFFKDFSYILKRELMWIPLYGFLLHHAGMIAVGRQGGFDRLVADVQQRQADGIKHFIIFPQGARRPFASPVRLLPGVFRLYEASRLPVVPVVLDSGRYWRRRRFVIHSGVIRLRFLAPIPPGLGRQAFMKRLREALCSSV